MGIQKRIKDIPPPLHLNCDLTESFNLDSLHVCIRFRKEVDISRNTYILKLE